MTDVFAMMDVNPPEVSLGFYSYLPRTCLSCTLREGEIPVPTLRSSNKKALAVLGAHTTFSLLPCQTKNGLGPFFAIIASF